MNRPESRVWEGADERQSLPHGTIGAVLRPPRPSAAPLKRSLARSRGVALAFCACLLTSLPSRGDGGLSASHGTDGLTVSADPVDGYLGTHRARVTLVPAIGELGLRTLRPKVTDFGAERIEFRVTGGRAGRYDVVVRPRRGDGTPVTFASAFTIDAPTIESLDPGSGPLHTPAMIYGLHFGDRRGSVKIGGRSARVTDWDDDSVRIVIPRGLHAGPKDVVLRNRHGRTTAPGAFTVTTRGAGQGEVLAADIADAVSSDVHFEATKRDPDTFRATYFVGTRTLVIDAALPGRTLAVRIVAPKLDTPKPFTLGTTPAADGDAYAAASYTVGDSAYSAGPTFEITVTEYDDNVVVLDFAGTLDLIAGDGPATVDVTNGHARVRLDIAQ